MLSRESIVDASIELVERHGLDGFSLRRLGTHLGVDATAVYRHFKGKDDLLRAVGDRIHSEILFELPAAGTWKTVLAELCIRLRASHLKHPKLAALIRSGPPRHANEFALTEAMFRELARSPLGPQQQALAYHALIELTVGSAALDSDLASRSKSDQLRTYTQWRRTYQDLDPAQYRYVHTRSRYLYAQSADERFVFALTSLIDGLGGRTVVPPD